jgi:hypothetical protein
MIYKSKSSYIWFIRMSHPCHPRIDNASFLNWAIFIYIITPTLIYALYPYKQSVLYRAYRINWHIYYKIMVFIPILKLLLSTYVNRHANSKLTGIEPCPILNPASNNGLFKIVYSMGIIAADFGDMFFQAALKKVVN